MNSVITFKQFNKKVAVVLFAITEVISLFQYGFSMLIVAETFLNAMGSAIIISLASGYISSEKKKNNTGPELRTSFVVRFWFMMFLADAAIISILSLVYITSDAMGLMSCLQNIFLDSVVASLISVFLILNHYILTLSITRRQKDDIVAKNRIAAVGMKLNDHFIFNSLSVLAGLIREDSSQAEEFVLSLADYYRSLTTIVESATVSVSEELKLLDHYLVMCRYRYSSGVQVIIEDSVRVAGDSKIIPLSLQHSVQNAIKHNSYSEKKPLVITLSCDGHEIAVSNVIIKKISEMTSSGIGLDSMREKYLMACGKEPEFIDENGVFTAKFPLI